MVDNLFSNKINVADTFYNQDSTSHNEANSGGLAEENENENIIKNGKCSRKVDIFGNSCVTLVVSG